MDQGRVVAWLRTSVAAGVLLLGAAQAQQPVTLTAGDGAGGDRFGVSVGFDGDALLVGASGVNIGAASDAGAAYVLRWNGSAWLQEQQLTAPVPVQLESFGAAVGLSGDLCVVGVPNRKLGLKVNAGAIHVYRRNAARAAWQPQQVLTAFDQAAFDGFGGTLALAQGRLVVGVPAHDVLGSNMQGAVYVYRWDGTAFVLEAQLLAPDGVAEDRFGSSVDVDGNSIVVGAPDRSDQGLLDKGAAYVFRLVGGTWQYSQKLLASDGAMLDRFGAAVSVDGDLLAVGAPGDDIGLVLERGSAYLYRDTGTLFTGEQKFAASDGAALDEYGSAVDLDLGMLVVGAPKDDVSALLDVGSAYLYRQTGTQWVEEQLFGTAEISAAAGFGSVLALDGGLLAFGVGLDKVGSFAAQGSACVYKAQSAAWTWLGHALPGHSGAPDLVGTGPLTAGSSVGLAIDDAHGSAFVALTIAFTPINAPFKGGTMVPAPDFVISGLSTDLAGALELGSVWPPGVPQGTPLICQAWFLDPAAPQGIAGSNSIVGTAP